MWGFFAPIAAAASPEEEGEGEIVRGGVAHGRCKKQMWREYRAQMTRNADADISNF